MTATRGDVVMRRALCNTRFRRSSQDLRTLAYANQDRSAHRHRDPRLGLANQAHDGSADPLARASDRIARLRDPREPQGHRDERGAVVARPLDHEVALEQGAKIASRVAAEVT